MLKFLLLKNTKYIVLKIKNKQYCIKNTKKIGVILNTKNCVLKTFSDKNNN